TSQPIDFVERTASHCDARSPAASPPGSQLPQRPPFAMPPRTLASLAQSLSVATDVESAMRALAESLAELDRFAQLAWVRFDARRSLMRERVLVSTQSAETANLDTTLDHLPQRERTQITAGGQF